MSVYFCNYINKHQPVYEGTDHRGDEVSFKFLQWDTKNKVGCAYVPYFVPSIYYKDLTKSAFTTDEIQDLKFVTDDFETRVWMQLRVVSNDRIQIINLKSGEILSTLHRRQ